MSLDAITEAVLREDELIHAAEEVLGETTPLTFAADQWREGIYLPPLYEIEE